MRRWLSIVLAAVLLTVSLPLFARSEPQLGEVSYGPWSDWVSALPADTNTLSIETRQVAVRTEVTVYTYQRYEYFNTDANTWYATSTAKPGSAERPGSGRWVERTCNEPLQKIGAVNGETCYEGQWFFEQISTRHGGYRSVTEYRYRTKSEVRCVLKEHDAAIARGATYQIEPDVLGGARVWYRSQDTNIATVDQSGVVRGVRPGQCDIDLMIGLERVESLRMNVGEQLTGLASGSYEIQLVGSDKYLAPALGVAKRGARLNASNYIPAERRYFEFQGAAERSFRIRLTAPEVLYLSVRQKDGAVSLYGRTNKLGQSFSILRLKGGQDLIYLTADPTRFLAVNRNGELEMRAFESISTTIRWKLLLQKEQEDAPASWTVPYKANGKCYVSANYQAGLHNGIDIGSYGVRVPALAVAPGVVVETYSGCTHDYGKETNAQGRQEDPCGGDRSFGNYVVVQHQGGMRTAYTHLSRVTVQKGDKLAQGDMVGMTGSTGSSTAVHLHFEVRDSAGNTFNPRQFIDFPKLDK